MGAALEFLERYHREGDEFLDHIVTGDEIWVSHFTSESKRQSLEWHHPRSPSKPRKFKHTLSTRKIMATLFGSGKASFWLSSCRQALPSTPNRIVQLWGGYDTQFKTDGEAYCQAAWCYCTTMRARMLLPERKQCFKSLAGKFLSIYSTLGPKWFSLVPKIEEIFGGQTLQKRWRSEGCRQGVG
jgi:hypothetical protein